MIRIDSLKLLIPSDSITEIDSNKMQSSDLRTDPGTGRVISDKLISEKLDIGFKSIRYDIPKGEAILEISGKILKDQYFELININTIERVFKEINKSSPIKFDPAAAIDHSQVLTMDCTDNLKLSRAPLEYVKTLNQVRINQRYNVTDYKEPGNVGIVIAGKQKSFKERQIFYDKIRDINRDQSFKNVPYLIDLQSKHTGILRAETNITSFAKIREFTGCDTTILKDILKSNERPNLKLFNKITKQVDSYQLHLFLALGKKYAGWNLSAIERDMGMEGIITSCNYDINLIIDFIKDHRAKGSNSSKAIRDYKIKLLEMIPENKAEYNNELIEEIRQSLAA